MSRRALCLALAGCAVDPGLPTDPVAGTGYVEVSVDVGALGLVPDAVSSVSVGGLRAYGLRAEGDRLAFVVQGGPPGGAPVVLGTDGGDVEVGELVYEGPADPLFDRFVAYGASLTQGTRDAVPTAASQLGGPALAVARAVGAWLPLPLLADPLTPMSPTDLGEDCAAPDTVAFILGGLDEATQRLTDPTSGVLDLARARVTPEVVPANVAVGNARIAAQRLGLATDPVASLLGRITLEAEGTELFAPLSQTPIERVLALEPTLVVSFDLFGNDALVPLVTGLGPDAMTPPEEVAAELVAQLDLLATTGADVVLANLPPVTLLPSLEVELTEAERGEANRIVEAYNAALRAEADARPYLHVADLAAEVARLDGVVVVDGTRLGFGPLQGLLSLDGVHFTDTGYALAANVVLGVLRDELGVEVDDLDLGPVLASDPRSPAALAAAGVDPACLVAP